MRKSESIKELGAALAKAQAEMKPLHKNSDNPFFKSKYADLNESVETLLPLLSKHGLSISQGVGTERGYMMETMLIHSSGEWIMFEWPVMLAKDKPGPQDFASSASYARRYSLQAIASAAASDDDGNAGQGKVEPRPYKPPSEPAKHVKNYAPGAEPLDASSFQPDPRGVGTAPVHDSSGLSFKITFGKNTGKTIGEVGLSECKSYVEWLKKSVKPGQEMSEKAKEFCDAVESIK